MNNETYIRWRNNRKKKMQAVAPKEKCVPRLEGRLYEVGDKTQLVKGGYYLGKFGAPAWSMSAIPQVYTPSRQNARFVPIGEIVMATGRAVVKETSQPYDAILAVEVVASSGIGYLGVDLLRRKEPENNGK